MKPAPAAAPAPAPDWLSDFQREFGAALREPLLVHAGALVPNLPAYPAALAQQVTATPNHAGSERLAVYNWQYWLRLFDLLQQAYPTVTRLLGPWALNRVATAFLLECPPREHDIDRAADGFAAFVHARPELVLQHWPAAAPQAFDMQLNEAARIDAAWRRVFAAPEEPALVLTTADLGRLASGRLVARQSFALVTQRWPLLQWRGELTSNPDAAVPVPNALDAEEHWALFRVGLAVGHVRLDVREARLLRLLETHSTASALGQLESELDAHARENLPSKVSEWFARAVRFGFWTRAE